MLHARNNHVLDETMPAKKFSFQIQSGNWCSYQAVIALGLLQCVIQHFFAQLIVKVQVPIGHDMCRLRRAYNAILDRHAGRG